VVLAARNPSSLRPRRRCWRACLPRRPTPGDSPTARPAMLPQH
jgi:hypothetical protein